LLQRFGVRVIVINTGTELLLGDVLNSHLAFIAREISIIGLRIDRQISVPDGEPIRVALSEVLTNTDIVFVTGGLGPTTDDITREITADLLGLRLHQDETVLAAIEHRAAHRGYRLTERTSRQADVPEGAIVLRNEHGSAPGLHLPANEKRPHLFLLPGPPRELHPMFVEHVMPILRKLVPKKIDVGRRTFHVVGIGESLVEKAVGEKLLEITDLEIGYCARPGEVDLRIIGGRDALDRAERIITGTLGNAVFSRDGRSLEESVITLLINKRMTIAVAESCTGGYLAHRITNVSGASAAFLAGYITYSNQSKVDSCGVDPELISKHGAVSEEVAGAMAEGARKMANTNFALATTGIAGPSGGTKSKPVGTVFVALASNEGPTIARHFFFPDDRRTFKELVSQAGLEMLRQQLLKSHNGKNQS
jgi:nicotinamide-nucleotide amidase